MMTYCRYEKAKGIEKRGRVSCDGAGEPERDDPRQPWSEGLVSGSPWRLLLDRIIVD
jgi:hypothetical protein